MKSEKQSEQATTTEDGILTKAIKNVLSASTKAITPTKDGVNVKWISTSNHLSQIYSSGMEYALCSKDNKQAHAFVRCKDWLQDTIWASLHNKPVSIYGFSYNPKNNPPIDLENVRLLIVNDQDSKMKSKIENVLDFLNQIEESLNLKHTVALDVKNPPSKYKSCGAVLFVGSKRWAISPPMISLFSLFLRVGFVHKKGDKWEDTVAAVISGKRKAYQTHDQSYLRSAKTVIDRIMKIGYAPIFFKDMIKNYPEKVSTSTLHNSSGIVALANGSTKSIIKYWTRKELDEKPAKRTNDEIEADRLKAIEDAKNAPTTPTVTEEEIAQA